MEDLRPDFEEKAAAIPDPVEISGEQISGDSADGFVKVPISDSTPQNTSQPVTLIKSRRGLDHRRRGPTRQSSRKLVAGSSSMR